MSRICGGRLGVHIFELGFTGVAQCNNVVNFIIGCKRIHLNYVDLTCGMNRPQTYRV